MIRREKENRFRVEKNTAALKNYSYELSLNNQVL